MKKFTFILTALIMCFGLCSAQLKTKIDIADVIPDLNPSMSVSDIQSRYAPRLYYLGVEWSDNDKCWYLKQKGDASKKGHMTVTMATKLARLTLAQDRPRAYYSEIYHCHGDAATRLLEMEKDTAKAREWLIQCDRLCFNRDVLASFLLNTEYFGYGGFTREELLEAIKICDANIASRENIDFYNEVLKEVKIIQKYRSNPDNLRSDDVSEYLESGNSAVFERPKDADVLGIIKPFVNENFKLKGFNFVYNVTKNGATLVGKLTNDPIEEEIGKLIAEKIYLKEPQKVTLPKTKFQVVLSDAKLRYNYTCDFLGVNSGDVRLVYSKKKGWHVSYASYNPPYIYLNNKKIFDDIFSKNEKIQGYDHKSARELYVHVVETRFVLYSEYHMVGEISPLYWVSSMFSR